MNDAVVLLILCDTRQQSFNRIFCFQKEKCYMHTCKYLLVTQLLDLTNTFIFSNIKIEEANSNRCCN